MPLPVESYFATNGCVARVTGRKTNFGKPRLT